MNLGIIGCGAIGTDVAIAANKMEEINKIYLYDIDKKKQEDLSKIIEKSKITNILDSLNDVDIVFEAASQKAVEQYSEKIL
ncbi:MAG: aspartate dehydrogenase, partial [Candidatus Thermoplasmatota archaeon]